ncbi:Regulating synaptic membrane exocytosis protein 2 [Fragariocoptes setiger]|uniref:Regulating synaptic membrane exocytosis protein 2 n=1 Tax=Fragariocoptes setiger TaxID=1670756 RepID=A0ABQ7S8Y4_9ACAR|nr:Regulating synaptic membrane exocytosis protein 2 [Fragariocoptes setiger]
MASRRVCRWQPSVDGKYLIGYIVIDKSDLVDQYNQYSFFTHPQPQQLTSSTIGATIIGGRVTQAGHIGTVIERIKMGSIADVKCQLRQGDEIAEWNGQSLKNLSFEEALDIMDSTRDVQQIRLVAVRSLVHLQHNPHHHHQHHQHSHSHLQLEIVESVEYFKLDSVITFRTEHTMKQRSKRVENKANREVLTSIMQSVISAQQEPSVVLETSSPTSSVHQHQHHHRQLPSVPPTLHQQQQQSPYQQATFVASNYQQQQQQQQAQQQSRYQVDYTTTAANQDDETLGVIGVDGADGIEQRHLVLMGTDASATMGPQHWRRSGAGVSPIVGPMMANDLAGASFRAGGVGVSSHNHNIVMMSSGVPTRGSTGQLNLIGGSSSTSSSGLAIGARRAHGNGMAPLGAYGTQTSLDYYAPTSCLDLGEYFQQQQQQLAFDQPQAQASFQHVVSHGSVSSASYCSTAHSRRASISPTSGQSPQHQPVQAGANIASSYQQQQQAVRQQHRQQQHFAGAPATAVDGLSGQTMSRQGSQERTSSDADSPSRKLDQLILMSSARHSKFAAGLHNAAAMLHGAGNVGMSSDSEINTRGDSITAADRIYHAHVAPRNMTHASSRVSHYSDSAAQAQQQLLSHEASAHSMGQLNQPRQQQQQQQASRRSRLVAQNTVASTSASTLALALGATQSSPTTASSQLAAQVQAQSGATPISAEATAQRRPFLHSRSIDRQNFGFLPAGAAFNASSSSSSKWHSPSLMSYARTCNTQAANVTNVVTMQGQLPLQQQQLLPLHNLANADNIGVRAGLMSIEQQIALASQHRQHYQAAETSPQLSSYHQTVAQTQQTPSSFQKNNVNNVNIDGGPGPVPMGSSNSNLNHLPAANNRQHPEHRSGSMASVFSLRSMRQQQQQQQPINEPTAANNSAVAAHQLNASRSSFDAGIDWRSSPRHSANITNVNTVTPSSSASSNSNNNNSNNNTITPQTHSFELQDGVVSDYNDSYNDQQQHRQSRRALRSTPTPQQQQSDQHLTARHSTPSVTSASTSATTTPDKTRSAAQSSSSSSKYRHATAASASTPSSTGGEVHSPLRHFSHTSSGGGLSGSSEHVACTANSNHHSNAAHETPTRRPLARGTGSLATVTSIPANLTADVSNNSRFDSSTGNAHNNAIGLTKKSNSATQLSMTGTKKRLGFRKKTQVTSFSVHRSEEVAPDGVRHLVKQGSSISEGESSMSGDSSSNWSNIGLRQQCDDATTNNFVEGLGRGQIISRQGLASPYLGDLQLCLCDRRGNLEIEVIRARNLVPKSDKVTPMTYVKLYLVKNRKCLAKAKTALAKRTLDPVFQQQLTFHEEYQNCIIQAIVWGNYGKMDKKSFMGIAQISIDGLELANAVTSWYRLQPGFHPSSLQQTIKPSKSLRHSLLSSSTESFTVT